MYKIHVYEIHVYKIHVYEIHVYEIHKKEKLKINNTFSKMNTIGGIIDMDGFEINKTFYCKEIGLLNMNGEVATSHPLTEKPIFGNNSIQTHRNN